ncbi:MAG TPA: PAS domain S-box protein, partial [Spirochaetia bacterium]|nr:PAS domain S-box protein [Spirochaetia bacterium]
SNLTWLVENPSAKNVTLPFGIALRYMEVDFGPFTIVQSFMGVVAGLYILWIGVRYWRRGHAREAGPLLLAMGFVFATAINDNAVSDGLYSFVYLLEYGYMAVILLMTFSLSRTVIDAAKTRDALRDSEERFRSLVETTSDWVWQIDQNGRYTYASPKSRDLLGYEPEEILGKTPFDLMPEKEAGKIRSEFQRILAACRPFDGLENTNLRKDGGQVVLQTSGVPIFGNKGEFLGYRGIDRDITEFKKSQDEQAKLQEQLQQALKMEAVGRLAGGVAHDFNNLLTAIIGNTDLARTRLGSSSSVAHFLDEVYSAAESAASLTRQLLAFSRRQLIQPRVMSLNELIGHFQKMMTRLLGEDVLLESFLDPEVGNVRADPGQLEQVLVNLAANARDAMPTGGKLTIETSNIELDQEYCAHHPEATPGTFVLLAISDTGHGMSEEVKAHAFEPFFTTKPVGQGTGLGLAQVFGIVKQSGGSVEVYSEEGQGTQFKIYLPRIEEEAEDLARNRVAADPPTGKETVLLVEDNESVRAWGIKALEHLQYRVLCASTVPEIIDLAAGYRDRIDLLITDVVLPGITGPALAERLLALHPEMKVLFTSGYTQNVIARHGIIREGLNFIAKPYTIQAFAAKIREVLAKPN